jgi:hypothetical protein
VVSAPEETGSKVPLGQVSALGSLLPPVNAASAQVSLAAPPSAFGQLEDDSGSITTSEDTLRLLTTVTTTLETPGPTGEAVGRDLSQGTKVLSPPSAGQATEGVEGSQAPKARSKKTWTMIAAAFKATLSGAVSVIPEPFKGPAEVLLKVYDAFEVS